MEVYSPLVKKIVDEYDFVFSSGMVMPLTVDKSLGDTIEFTEAGVKIILTPKPSMADPEVSLPGEEVTIFSKHLLAIQHRKREVTELTPEEKTATRDYFKTLSTTAIKH